MKLVFAKFAVLWVCATVLVAGGLGAGLAIAEDASPETAAAVERLLAVNNPTAMMKDLAPKIAKNLPEKVQQAFIDAMLDKSRMARLEDMTRKSMAVHFSVEELNALADFYGSPVGKSAMEKMPNYMADLMPQIQKETRKLFMEMMAKGKEN